PTRVGSSLAGVPVVGLWDEVSEIVARGGIDQVVMALPFERLPTLAPLVSRLDTAVGDFKVVPGLERLVGRRSGSGGVEGLPVISLRATPLAGWGRVAKRAMDVALSVLALILFAPLLGLIALAIRASSPGPVLFAQDRMGLDGRVFRVWKFRTMRTDAEA